VRRPQPSTLAGRDEVKGRLFFTTTVMASRARCAEPQLDGDVFIPPTLSQDPCTATMFPKIQRLGGATGAQRAEAASFEFSTARIPRWSVSSAMVPNTM